MSDAKEGKDPAPGAGAGASESPPCWFDGAFMREEEARVPVSDPALAWGVGLFEVARVYERCAFRLDAHVERLVRSAEKLDIAPALPPLDELAAIVAELCDRQGVEEGALRLTVTGGGHRFLRLGPLVVPPPEVYEEGATLLVADWRRDARGPLAGHKTLNYFVNMVDRKRAWEVGSVDTIVLGLEDEVLEGTRSNLFAALGGELVTPALASGILAGITRRTVFELAEQLGVRLVERVLPFEELAEARELFVTSSLMEVVPVARVGTLSFEPSGPLTRAIRRAYAERVARECGLSRRS